MTRQRNIFDADQVAHLWANGAHDTARTATGNLFIASIYVRDRAYQALREESAIWSYGRHFCIARFAKLPRGGVRAVLWNRNGYSATTAKHKSKVLQALRADMRGPYFFTVDKPDASNKAEHRANLADYRDRYETAVKSAGRSRIREATRAALLAESESILAEANRYAEAFRLGKRLTPTDTAAISARVVREERKAEKQRAEQARAAAERNAEAVREFEERLPEWKRGEISTHSLPQGRLYAPTYLRLVTPEILAGESTAQSVETTRGATFPADDARKAWPIVKACREQSREFRPEGLRSVRFGHFGLDRIDSDGTIHAGCHTVRFEQARELALALGLES